MNFPNTHWSALAKATMNGESAGCAALDTLCRAYWKPVRDFISFRGFNETEADDLAQTFLMRLCEKSVWKQANSERGRFRSFLLGALSHFLADELDRRNAAKRGGGATHVSLEDFSDTQISMSVNDETRFDREWALAILENALQEIHAEFGGRVEEFEVVRKFLPGASESISLEEGAAKLGCGLAAMKSQVHRLRTRFRELVRERVAVTVSAPHEIESEIRHLGRVLMDRGTPL